MKILIPAIIMIVLLLVYTFVIFLIVTPSPESITQEMREFGASDEQIRQVITEQGLDVPLMTRYFRMLTGNFGVSLLTRQPVAAMIGERLPATFILVLASLIVSLVFAVPMGIISAVMRTRVIDTLCSAVSMLCKSFPFFWLALLMIGVFSIDLGWFPTMGSSEEIVSYVMPVFILGFSYFGFAMQAVRASTVKALGNQRAGIFFPESDNNDGRAFQNAILPSVARSGLQTGWLLFGVIIVEGIFAMPGVGVLFLQGIMQRDTPVILGGIMALSYCFIITAAVGGLVFALITFIIRSIAGRRGYEYA